MKVAILTRAVMLSLAVCGGGLSFGSSAQNPTSQSGGAEPRGQVGVCGGVTVVVEEGQQAARGSGGPFTIDATYDGSVGSAERAVIQRAVSEWDSLIQTRGVNRGDYPISFSYAPLDPNVLGGAKVCTDLFGNLTRTTITFNSDFNWFVDPTPADDSEFQADGTGGPPGIDLLSVARHEVGHAVGWTNSSSRPGDFIVGNVFDRDRMNIEITTATGLHADDAVHVNDLMVPRIGASTRRRIRHYPDTALIARAYRYDVVMKFVDQDCGSDEGSANDPWHTVGKAGSQAPSGSPVLVIPNCYLEAPVTISRSLTLQARRGGDVEIKSCPKSYGSIPNPTIPNVFTPNNDGVNDVWGVNDVQQTCWVDARILNRFGQIVFEKTVSQAIDNNGGFVEIWDGRQCDRSEVSQGTYFYFVTLRNCNQERDFEGFMTLLR